MRQHYRDNIQLLTYSYDAAGRTTSLVGTLAGVTKVNLAYQWDNANRLTRITDSAGNHRVDFAYTLTGDYLTLTRYADTNGTQLVATSSYAYDNADRLTSLIHALGTGGGTSLSYALAYDANSQITSITSGDGVNNFSNDNNGQLTASTLTSESYSYDATGNRTSGGTVTGADNRVSEDATYTYSYDNEGNLLTRTAKDGSGSDTFAWDYRNRLTQTVTKDGNGNVTLTTTYAYDAFDRRIRRTLAGSSTLDEQYLYDGTGDADIVLVTDGTETVTLRQLNGPGSNQVLAEDRISGTTTTTCWALSDHEGTVRDVVDHAGDVVDHIVYSSYGNITSQSNASEQMRATYTGAPTDSETGFVYLHHRYYNPTTGRWMSQDPLSFGAGDVNLSRYCFNNPVNYTDPSGQIVPFIIIGGVLLILGTDGVAWAPTGQETPEFVRAVEHSNAMQNVAVTTMVVTGPLSAGLGNAVGGRVVGYTGSRALGWATDSAVFGTTQTAFVDAATGDLDYDFAHPGDFLRRSALSGATYGVFRASAYRPLQSPRTLALRSLQATQEPICPWKARHQWITNRLREHLYQAVKQAELTPAQVRDIIKNGRGSQHWGTQIDSAFKNLVQNDWLLGGEVAVSPRSLPKGSQVPDVIDLRTKNWWDVTTTTSQYNLKTPRYNLQFGGGTPLLYAE